MAPGDELTIEGDSWGDACNDTPGLGCDPPSLGEPIQGIRVQLRSVDGPDTVDLGTIHADDEYSLGMTVEVDDLPPGPYLVTARADDHRATARLRIVRN